MASPAKTTLGGLVETFVRRWGDMGAVWGINRTMAEIQGLLYITGERFCTDDIMARLRISRGSASMSLRALVDWGVVRRVHQPGDRRDYYESLENVWEIFSRVAQRRKRREIDPILETLHQCRREHAAAPPSAGEEISRDRLEHMLSFLSIMEELAQRFIGSEDGLARAVELLGKRPGPPS